MEPKSLYNYLLISQITIILGFIADLIFGDPRWFPHPVKGIGHLIKKLEPFFRKKIKNERNAGIFFTITIILIVFLITLLIIFVSITVNVWLFLLISAFIIYSSISLKDLKLHVLKVYDDLKNNDIILARKDLSMIVGRDTENLNKDEIIRATIETIAENLVDGVLSVLFWAFIMGAPGAMLFKTTSTLDSMVGYKDEKYKYFGMASAKIDDYMNFIPARISMIIIPLAAFIYRKDVRNCIKIIKRDRKKNPSPNSGIPESAFAGTLKIQLGGLNFYNKIPVYKEKIGEPLKKLEIDDIKISINLTYISSFLFLIFFICIFCLIYYLLYTIYF